MTASALASPALSESSISTGCKSALHLEAQTSMDRIELSQQGSLSPTSPLFNRAAIEPVLATELASSPSPSLSGQGQNSLSSPSVSPQSSPSPLSLPLHHMFTATPTTTLAQQQVHHHLQILGNHPASPVACTFLDLPADPFMPTRANLLFSDCEYEQPHEYSDNTATVYDDDSLIYSTPSATSATTSTASPTMEDCQASNAYIYSQQQQQQRIKNEFSNEQFVASLGGIGSNYMIPVGRSFSDGQLSEICEHSASISAFANSLTAQAQASLNQATGCATSSPYTSHVVYSDDYYASAQQHHLYSQQQHQNNTSSHNHGHSHSYSTSSLSSLSEDTSSSLSPRSPFMSTNGNALSLSNSCSSIASTYPLSRTLSEPSLPFLQAVAGVNMSMSTSAANSSTGLSGVIGDVNGTLSAARPTPKRSRGRRVSCNPDTSGCKVFTCRFEDCGKVFKRSEHLKRHVRSIHTMEKPFECPIPNCPKRFSRSDNLNQHIRIHRHSGRGDKTKSFNAFTPFLQNYPTELLSLS
ncbi:hypothetical protein BGW38_007691 [Lunasporangiospora selenospora]|uniref:C2H2-type domain-containing protein n=1 Tax=Lunasporangiospora selenospora TaxID=979761 RepID=A0A9P6FM38_9FUNG|nr:hypothetical protein BGW38_007691 [Lunasporangiospora selenospora]